MSKQPAARSKRAKRNLSWNETSLKTMIVAGSAMATFLGASAIAQMEPVVETAVVAPIIIQPTAVGQEPLIINQDPIPQVVIPDPVVNSRSSR